MNSQHHDLTVVNYLLNLCACRNASQKVQVSLSLSESMLCVDTDNQEAVPRNYRLDVTPVTSQMLGVFSQGSGKMNFSKVNSHVSHFRQ